MSAGNGKKPPEADAGRLAMAAAAVADKPSGGGGRRGSGRTRAETSDKAPPTKPPQPSKPPSKPTPAPAGSSAQLPPEQDAPSPPPEDPPPPAPAASPTSRLFVVCLVLAAAILAGVGYMLLWQRLDGLQADLHASLGSFGSRVARLENRPGNADRLEALEAAVVEMRLQVGAENLLWALAEVESLLALAVHRLDLDQDVAGALYAMTAADVRLEGLTDVGLIPVRAQLQADMNALRDVEVPDLRLLSRRLTDIYRSIGHLPVRAPVVADDPPATETSSEDRPGWLQSLWHWMQKLVSLRRVTDSNAQLYAGLGQEQAAGLARLQVEHARLSLQERDEQSFRAALHVIRGLLVTHYDAERTTVQNTLEQIGQLEQVRLEPELPPLDSSIEALRAYAHARLEERP